jgi:hypothetical protein
MSPFQDSANPLGAGNETPRIGGAILIWACDPAVTAPLVGDLVELEAYTPVSPPGDSGATAPTGPYVRTTETTVNFRIVGVCVGGTTLGTNPVAGGLCMVVLEGPALINMDNTTTVNHLVVASATTAGKGHDAAAAVLGQTIAVVLQAVTISSGTSPVYCYVHKV